MVTDPRGFLANLPDDSFWDEIQRLPQLLSYIRGTVDRANKKGVFSLTGSHQSELHQSASQTLVGRTVVLSLLPFLLAELRNYRKNHESFEIIIEGSYPRLNEEKLKPSRFFNGYLQTNVIRS